MSNKAKRIIVAVALLLVAVLSFTVLYNAFSADKFVRPRVQYLDEKKTTVMEMSAVAIAASAAITLVPGDIGTPIADKLADLSKYSVIILCAVFLEKYLLKLIIVAAFRIIIPVGLLIVAICLLVNRDRFFRLGARLVICGVLIASIIPVSVFISQTIESTYQETIQETIETAKEDTKEIEDNSESQSAIERFINSIKGGVKTVTDKFEKTLTNMIEAFAVMIVTSCLIPIVVFLLFWWLLRSLFNEDTFRRGPTLPLFAGPRRGGAVSALATEAGNAGPGAAGSENAGRIVPANTGAEPAGRNAGANPAAGEAHAAAGGVNAAASGVRTSEDRTAEPPVDADAVARIVDDAARLAGIKTAAPKDSPNSDKPARP
ncbi:MAG: hypothetical protein IJM39_05610 [Firmicutes bacterium]|nr:hypothetical protein [Bacillota bacterium]